MQPLTSHEIRAKWLSFFKDHGHYVLSSASLIPHNDPSLLWINSGVATLKPYFSGLQKPVSNRLTSSQKCIRTNDIENVGVTSRHHTFFEMLGNFSIGDYFKKEAIGMAYDLLVKQFKLDLEKIYITVYEEDHDAWNYWLALGIKKDHLVKGNKDRNFWDVGNGPCGPCTEIYYDRGEQYDPDHVGIKLFQQDLENDRYVEIWNIVFSQFNNDGKNNYSELVQKNIDTGAGLERLACVLQNAPTNYDTDLFQPVIHTLEKFTNSKYDQNVYFTKDPKQKWINQHLIVIADHFKACIFAIGDGAVPSAKDRGAVIRKLLRRSLVYAWQLKINNKFIPDTVNAIIDTVKDHYQNLDNQRQQIVDVITKEQNLFNQTFDNGIKLFNSLTHQKTISGKDIFKLTDTYGFPYEAIKSMCEEQHISFDEKEYFAALTEHQNISRSNKNVKAMVQQNDNLIQFTARSDFDYEKLNLKNAKIIAIFDEQFNPLKEVKNKKAYLVFDHTVFYATSGGQVHDVGTITINQQNYRVLDVIKAPNGQHLHLIEIKSHPIKVNDKANLEVDQKYRIDTMRNHSSEHLLQKALQTIISSNIYQQGALKTNEKLTFDFSYASKLTSADLLKVEQEVNRYIQSNAKVVTRLMSLDEAKKLGAQAHFEKVYEKIKGDLRVVDMEGITKEVCGGTHVKNLKDIEQFMIVNFDTKGGGLYRIEAITGHDHIKSYITKMMDQYKKQIHGYQQQLTEKHGDIKSFNQYIEKLNFTSTIDNYHALAYQIYDIEQKYLQLLKEATHNLRNESTQTYINQFNVTDKQSVIYQTFNDANPKALTSALASLSKTYSDKSFVAINTNKERISYMVFAGKNVTNNQYQANNIVNELNKLSQGNGGGSSISAQGGTKHLDTLPAIKKYLNSLNF